MSFVGPQPFTAGQEHLYLAAGGNAYFHLRPGVTGPWQIEGRGATNFVDRVRFDDDYHSKASLGCDLRLTGDSFGLLLKGSDSYAAQNGRLGPSGIRAAQYQPQLRLIWGTL